MLKIKLKQRFSLLPGSFPSCIPPQKAYVWDDLSPAWSWFQKKILCKGYIRSFLPVLSYLSTGRKQLCLLKKIIKLFCTFLRTDKSKPDILYVISTYCLFKVLMICSAPSWTRSNPCPREWGWCAVLNSKVVPTELKEITHVCEVTIYIKGNRYSKLKGWQKTQTTQPKKATGKGRGWSEKGKIRKNFLLLKKPSKNMSLPLFSYSVA